MPWLKRLVAGLSPRRPGFEPGPGICGGQSGTGQVFSEYFGFPCKYIIPPLLHIHLSPPHEVFDCSDQAAHYHNLGPQLGASLLTRHIGWKQKNKVLYILLHFACKCSCVVIPELNPPFAKPQVYFVTELNYCYHGNPRENASCPIRNTSV
jgi:hypothetical protein